MTDGKAETDLLNRVQVKQVFGNDSENKEETIGAVRDDQVREDGMGMPASADYSLYPDGMIDSPAGDKVDQVPVIRSMELTGMRGTTTGTGLHFRGKTIHK
ncbi:MAG: hypothetical protein IJZ34_15615 [Lachnospiraceae bacterium]|nr:hypothetical protein [Lachnospiraceae bacterium]